MSAEAPRPLPWLLRTSTWICLVFAGLVSLVATQELVLLFSPHLAADASQPGFGPALAPEVAERLTRVQRQSLEGMAIARGMVLAGLVLTTGMTLVGAARLLFPAGLPREPIRRLLAGTALLSGVLRVIDGAQIAVVVRKGSLVLAESLNASHFPGLSAENLELVRKASPALAMGTAILFTAMVAGVFVLYGQYLGSERVRKLFAEEPSTEHTGT